MKAKTIIPFFALLFLAAFIAVSCSNKTETTAKEEVKVENKEVAMAGPMPPPGYATVNITSPASITFKPKVEKTSLGIYKDAETEPFATINYLSTTGFNCYFDATHFYYIKETISLNTCTKIIAGTNAYGYNAKAEGDAALKIKGEDDNRAGTVNPGSPTVSRTASAKATAHAFVLYYDYNKTGDSSAEYDAICIGN